MGRGLGLRLCRKKELGKFHRELGFGVDGRGLQKVRRAGLGFLKFIWGFNIGSELLNCELCEKLRLWNHQNLCVVI